MYPLKPPQELSGDTVLLVSAGNIARDRGSKELATTAVDNTNRIIGYEECILNGIETNIVQSDGRWAL